MPCLPPWVSQMVLQLKSRKKEDFWNMPTCRLILFSSCWRSIETHAQHNYSFCAHLAAVCLKLPETPGNLFSCGRGILFWLNDLTSFSSAKHSRPTKYHTCMSLVTFVCILDFVFSFSILSSYTLGQAMKQKKQLLSSFRPKWALH